MVRLKHQRSISYILNSITRINNKYSSRAKSFKRIDSPVISANRSRICLGLEPMRTRWHLARATKYSSFICIQGILTSTLWNVQLFMTTEKTTKCATKKGIQSGWTKWKIKLTKFVILGSLLLTALETKSITCKWVNDTKLFRKSRKEFN